MSSSCSSQLYNLQQQERYNSNLASIRSDIMNKLKSSKPYFATKEQAREIVTDYNEFPFHRFWRPAYDLYKREAGWHPVVPNKLQLCPSCDKNNCLVSCFQYPCSTVLPCNDMSSNKCITLYR